VKRKALSGEDRISGRDEKAAFIGGGLLPVVRVVGSASLITRRKDVYRNKRIPLTMEPGSPERKLPRGRGGKISRPRLLDQGAQLGAIDTAQ